MSSASIPVTYLDRGIHEFGSAKTSRISPPIDNSVLRRPDQRNGRALETLGHAIEYLVDSRIFSTGSTSAETIEEAVAILSCASRQIFNECPAIVPLRRKLAIWIATRLGDRQIAKQ